MPNYSGGCLCGDVRYTVTGTLRPVIYCHCGQCKKTSGNFVAATACDNVNFNMQRDESLRWYTSSVDAKRGFCSSCGSNLFWKPVHGQHLSIFAGTLDSDVGLTARAHIFVANKAAYLHIGDGLPQHQLDGPSGATSGDE